MNDPLLDPLNPEQREAVTASETAVLILAGAGSGKTRVIAHRAAYLLSRKAVSPHGLLAVTFTNKAAGEMRERILKLLGKESLPFLWIGTFHATCARILRADIAALDGPWTRDFTIVDADDSQSLLRHILKDRDISEKNFQPRAVASAISRAKAEGLDAMAFEAKAHTYYAQTLAPVYLDYERRLRESNCMDFDDLLHLTERLLEGSATVRERYRERFEHILVDEYQDTNRTQYRLLQHLSGPRTHLFAVGDEDQSVYRWRGADIGNILDFQRDFPGARVIKLERNYRSTAGILQAANALVAHNDRRLGKNLWTERPGGSAVTLFCAPTDREEAAFVADTARAGRGGLAYRQMAVLYRTNAQSRVFEEAFLNRSIPYQVVGGLKFYDRKEVKDILAYLRLAVNPADRISLLRVINLPPRGLGKSALDHLAALADERGTTLMQAVREGAAGDEFPARTRMALKGFLDIVNALASGAEAESPADLCERALNATGYVEYITSLSSEGPDPQSRVENLQELISAMRDYEAREGGDLRSFLERQVLSSDQDALDDAAADTVKLMTLHSAKGLEFPVVFLTGIEEDLVPHVLARESKDEVEEERRLCYVGMTRAMDRLYLSWARQRYVFGVPQSRNPSPFLREIPMSLLDEAGGLPSPVRVFDDAPPPLLPPAFSSPFGTAARQVPASPPPPSCGGLRVGARVHHSRFGFGIVVLTEGEGEDLKVTVRFNRYGSKRLLASVAKLEVV
jgi:DNA helicase-2/ATP-dependent DNA helicase PcrA